MYKLLAAGSILMFAVLRSLSGQPEITLGAFSFVIAIALVGAGLDDMENKKN